MKLYIFLVVSISFLCSICLEWVFNYLQILLPYINVWLFFVIRILLNIVFIAVIRLTIIIVGSTFLFILMLVTCYLPLKLENLLITYVRNVTEVIKYKFVNLVVNFSSVLEYLLLSLAYSNSTKTWNKHDKHFISIVLSYYKKWYVFLALFLWWYIKVLITYLVEIEIFFIKILSNKIIF